MSNATSEINAPPVVLQSTAVSAPVPVSGIRPPTPVAVRLWCLMMFGICASMLGVGLWLHPDARGSGTHQQLGLPPCGFFAMTGYPCPTCGCTTAVSNFSHGHFLTSFLTQPFGFFVALVAAAISALAVMGMVTGKWLGPSMFWLSWYWRMWIFGTIGILGVSWVYKIILVQMGHG